MALPNKVLVKGMPNPINEPVAAETIVASIRLMGVSSNALLNPSEVMLRYELL
jgi:hypothetical protein